MDVFKYPAAFDPAKYAADAVNPERLYGLPAEIKFCASCTYSNQKPNSEKEYKHNINTKKPTVAFDEEGVCSACRITQRKRAVDWDAREKQLRELCDRYRENQIEWTSALCDAHMQRGSPRKVRWLAAVGNQQRNRHLLHEHFLAHTLGGVSYVCSGGTVA